MSKLENAVVAAEINLNNVKTLTDNQIKLTNLAWDLVQSLNDLHYMASFTANGKHNCPEIWKALNDAQLTIEDAKRILEPKEE